MFSITNQLWRHRFASDATTRSNDSNDVIARNDMTSEEKKERLMFDLNNTMTFLSPEDRGDLSSVGLLVSSVMFSNLFFLTIIPILFNISLPTCLYNELFEPQRLSQFGRFLKLIVKSCFYYFFTFHLKLFRIMIIST